MPQTISEETAIDMTTLYRDERENILASGYKDQNILPVCETFDRNVFDTILGQTGCTSIRIYYGMDTNLKVHAIIVGANEENEDMLATGNIIAEQGYRCPEECPPPSSLNS
jgi:hypothetical protein